MIRFITLSLIYFSSTTHSFVTTSKPSFLTRVQGSKDPNEVIFQKSYTSGTLVEFTEKKRVHIGKIVGVSHKSNGGARYDVEDIGGQRFSIPDKGVNYAMPISANEERHIKKIFDDFVLAQEESETELLKDLDISPDLLEMAWEESLEDDSHELTASNLVEIVHSHAASKLEDYKAWRLLRTETAHVFFKELKDHGKVVAFKARAQNAVEAAKKNFCINPDHADNDLCWV